MTLSRAFLFLFAITLALPSCVIYRNYDREVRVWNDESGKPARSMKFSYSHATPAPHFPRTPDPVSIILDERGEALVSIPGAFGWVRIGDYGALLEASEIRDGGTFGLSRLSQEASMSRDSPWKITLRAPTKPNIKKENKTQEPTPNQPSD